jgi:hypothetical protein
MKAGISFFAALRRSSGVCRPGPAEVDTFLDEVRLLTLAEMRTLFPDCTLLRERFCGMTKSYIAVRSRPPEGES